MKATGHTYIDELYDAILINRARTIPFALFDAGGRHGNSALAKVAFSAPLVLCILSATTTVIIIMSAIFDFSSLIMVLVLMICTCAYLRELRPTIFDGGKTLQPGERMIQREGLSGFCWKLSRIGERLSPYIGASCAIMAIHVLFFK